MAKIKGFNNKEQRLFNAMADGELHDFRQLKKIFWQEAKEQCEVTYEKGWGEAEIDSQAQSFARNSIRRLIRDEWVQQVSRGTYKLTRTGSQRVAKGMEETTSYTGRAPRGSLKKAKEEQPKRKPGRPKKEKTEAAPKKKPGRPKKEKTEAAPKKKPGRPKKVVDLKEESKRKPGRPKKVKGGLVPIKSVEDKVVKLKRKVAKEAKKENGQDKASKAAAAVAAAIREDQQEQTAN